jgi:hypothetical protein
MIPGNVLDIIDSKLIELLSILADLLDDLEVKNAF